METLFGRGRWIYWLSMLAIITAVAIVIARRKSPEDTARQRLAWGDAAMEARHYDQAIAFYKKAIAKDPNLVAAYYNLALAYENVDAAKAAAAWDEYIARAEGDAAQTDWLATAREHRARLRASPHLEKAAALYESEDYGAARAEYAAALAFSPDDLNAREGAAANEAAAGDWRAAAAHYERAVAVAPYSLLYRYDLAGAYEHFDREKAAASYAELLEMSETHVGLKKEKLAEAQRRLAALRAEGYGR
jgi:tetratricopeptide (TPR) repeat protein